jgi:hypothetical protein
LHFETRVIILEFPSFVGDVPTLAAVPGNHCWQQYFAAFLDNLLGSLVKGSLIGVGAFSTFAVPEMLAPPSSVQHRGQRRFAGRTPVGVAWLDLSDVRRLVLRIQAERDAPPRRT